MESDNPNIRIVERQLSPEQYLPLMEDVLSHGGRFPLTITGNSMQPTFFGGRDQVILQRPVFPLRKGDVPLYRREDGTIVLHRVVRVNLDGSFHCCGDNQYAVERELQPDQVLAVAAAFVRKGHRFHVKALPYRIWVVLWCGLRDLRRFAATIVRRSKTSAGRN